MTLSIFLILLNLSLFGQSYFTEIQSRWSDRFDQWELSGMYFEEPFTISIDLTWPLQNNWEEWRISGLDLDGYIRSKWRGDPSMWEVRFDDRIVTIQLRSGIGNPEWEIREDGDRQVIRPRSAGNGNEWYIPRRRNDWLMYTEYVDDPRVWLIEDYLDEEHSITFRIALVFIALWQSIPK